VYDVAALEAALSGTIYAGKLHFSAATGSTNSDALSAAREGAPHGSVYFADEQTAGRGRGDHRWESNAGQGLYVSVLLRLDVPTVRLPLLPLAVGSRPSMPSACERPQCGPALAQRFADRGSQDGRHLVESKTDGDGLAFAVAGIGINVHQVVSTWV